jgi:hypothetical protein
MGVLAAALQYDKDFTWALQRINDKIYQLLTQGRWLSPASSTTKIRRHDIAEILLKVALNTKIQIQILLIIALQCLYSVSWALQRINELGLEVSQTSSFSDVYDMYSGWLNPRK